MAYRAVLFDIGGPIDLEFAWEGAVDSAIAAACGLEGIRVNQAMIEEASEAAVAAFAPDAYAFMVQHLCGDVATAERVTERRKAMVGRLDVFQMRPDMPGLLRRLASRGLRLGIVANQPARMADRLAREGIVELFAYLGLAGLTGLRKPDARAFTVACDALGVTPVEAIMVGDRIDIDIAPAKALGMATVLFRSGRHRRQRPRDPSQEPDAVVTDVLELDRTIGVLLSQ
jgi:HAD superfamily hydrolase (TIGR01549 family)